MTFIGIGSGNPDHLTGHAIKALALADLVLIPVKPDEKQELADLRDQLCDIHLGGNPAKRAYFDMPERDETILDYALRVEAWHDEIAARWQAAIPETAQNIVMLIWGDPSLFDSSLRIVHRLPAQPSLSYSVVPGLTSLQLLTAAHGIALNTIGEPVLITTGRQLRQNGWPQGVDTLAVMLDGSTAFTDFATEGVEIWWGAYLGMSGEILISGDLGQKCEEILTSRRTAKSERGWIMDIYLLRRKSLALA